MPIHVREVRQVYLITDYLIDESKLNEEEKKEVAEGNLQTIYEHGKQLTENVKISKYGGDDDTQVFSRTISMEQALELKETTNAIELKKQTELIEVKEAGKTYKYDLIIARKNGENEYDDTFDTLEEAASTTKRTRNGAKVVSRECQEVRRVCVTNETILIQPFSVN